MLWSVRKWAEGVESISQRLPIPVVQRESTRHCWWARFRKGSPPVAGHDPDTACKAEDSKAQDDDRVDVVVVDRSWTEEPETSVHEDSKSTSTVPPSVRAHNTSSSSTFGRRIFHVLKAFFRPHFDDPTVEANYQKEVWADSKRLAVFASIFFISNWVLGVIFVPQPLDLSDKIYYYGVAPVLSVPLVLLCAYDFPRDYATFYQCYLTLATWSWSFYQVLFLFLCDYYNSSDIRLFTCGAKDFLSTFYYTTALQTVALFGTNLRRLPAVTGAVMFLLFSGTLIDKASWTRNIINFLAYQIFLLYMHYQRDISARRLYNLRNELQEQVLRTQKAQINERKAADSKHRLTSYVFHEVRVPLNTALLAVQNMGASGTIAKSLDVEFTALEGSLSMMSKVLNDVLDFNRMDTGRFESLARPYSFHQVMRSLFLPLRLATDARNLELVTDLDMAIDDIARRAALEAAGETPETINRILKDQPSGIDHTGIVVGDETRLMQIVFNLASNACKFTPGGGKLTITTRLILPDVSSCRSSSNEPPCDEDVSRASTAALSRANLKVHDLEHATNAVTDWIVVRIEVKDTGCGIRSSDMEQTKLFSAFNQTEQGRRQGGKGTGLGLALVRLIVKLSHGRLGVWSKPGQGSTFWVELPLGIGAKALDPLDEPGPESPQSFQDVVHLAKGREEGDRLSGFSERVSQSPSSQSPKHQMSSTPALQRSVSALQSLMDQGGLVELSLTRHDSRSSILTRTMDDLRGHLPGTGYPLPSHSHQASDDPAVPLLAAPIDPNSVNTQRPTYIALPPRSSIFSCDRDRLTSSSSPSSLPTSPLSRSVLFEPIEVLVVDDDALTRALMKRMLERLGVAVTTAENGELALGILLGEDNTSIKTPDSDTSGPILERVATSRSRFSVIFLDNHMPVLSGLQMTKKLRSLGRKDFIVGITADALINDQNEYLEAGADHVLTKPVLERSLRNMLQLAEERRKQTSNPSPDQNNV